jgi:hypothetical protein
VPKCTEPFHRDHAGESVRAIGVDSVGNVIEPEAISRLAIGWYLTAAAFLTLTVLAIALMRRVRPTMLRR